MKTVLKNVVIAILAQEAKWLLARHKPTIIAITGSVGKTTTKDAIYAAIKNSVPARKSEKSFNSEIGVSLTVLGLSNGWNSGLFWLKNILDGLMIALFSKEYPAVLVLETGIDRPGDMSRLTKWLKPDIVVLTRLPSVPVHVEYFPTPEAVADEKMKLVIALKPNGTLVYNNDDTIIQSRLQEVRQHTVGFSRYLESDYTGSADRVVYADDVPIGLEFTLTHGQESVQMKIDGTTGTQQVYAVAAAAAVASVLGVSLSDVASSMRELKTPGGRARLIPGIKATTILDDTYNSSPTATEQALQTLGELKYAKRKIAVLGDMMELGRFSSQEHERIGHLVPKVADILLTVGVRSQKIAEGALENGMSEKNIFQYEDAESAGRELQNMLQPGDMVLVKGSQSIRAERIVEEIMAEPDRAPELLVRQEEEWKRR